MFETRALVDIRPRNVHDSLGVEVATKVHHGFQRCELLLLEHLHVVPKLQTIAQAYRAHVSGSGDSEPNAQVHAVERLKASICGETAPVCNPFVESVSLIEDSLQIYFQPLIK
eukprot:2485502-Pleurochrysis_carterae.AAC.4